MKRLREMPAWVLPAAVFAVIVILFFAVSPVVGMAVAGIALAVTVVRFAGWGRLLQIGIVIVLVMFFVSMLIRLLPGDPTVNLIPFSTAEQRAELREELGLNDPIYVQFGGFLQDFFTGDYELLPVDRAGSRRPTGVGAARRRRSRCRCS